MVFAIDSHPAAIAPIKQPVLKLSQPNLNLVQSQRDVARDAQADRAILAWDCIEWTHDCRSCRWSRLSRTP
ncbi:MAG: hypothetical protein RMX65_036050 [Nostoc sp. DedQUE01]